MLRGVDPSKLAILRSAPRKIIQWIHCHRIESHLVLCIDVRPMIIKAEGCFPVSLKSCHDKSRLSIAWLFLVHISPLLNQH